MENRSSEESFSVSGTINVYTVVYTGNQRNKVKSMPFSLNISANTKEIVRLEVAFDEYYLHIIDEVWFGPVFYITYFLIDFRFRPPSIFPAWRQSKTPNTNSLHKTIFEHGNLT